MTPEQPPTVGAILAGGLARRMGGGDKPLRAVGGRTSLARIVERLASQTVRVILNANDDPRRFGSFGLPVVADTLPDHPGPLAGVLAALDWTATTIPAVGWVVSVPGDAPFVPRDLVARLHAARQSSDTTFACAASQGRTHPVIALWPVAIRDRLRRAVAEQGIRKIDLFTERDGCAAADWPASPVDPFFNVNTPEDLLEADRLVALYPDL
ncbi:MAG: molybdenum cofactor guanylyltransferase MobA [Alphaproteobacteria bacterium]|nr:molybdenum cofactor guanylyltransferase MobA [Alphaproteobacteria bacterium]